VPVPTRPIYLDYNATTPLDPEVLAAMRPFLGTEFGNPSSAHAYGHAPRAAVARARAQVAALLGAREEEIVFTGGGSEADNLAIVGVAFSRQERGRHLITSAVEHPAVLATCRYLERRHGFALTVVPVDGAGRVDPDDVRRAIRPDTILISIMHAQNEVGTLQPVAEVAAIARERDILLHTDAAQSVGKVPVHVAALGADLVALAGHKVYAPKGVGALYVRSGLQLEPLIHGAGHEGGRRAGTENVAGIVGLGAACALAEQRLPADGARLRGLREELWGRLAAAIPGVRRHGAVEASLPNTLHLGVPGIPGDALLAAAPAVAASTGSACHAGHTEPSAVLLAMGLAPEEALTAVRLSLGRFTTPQEVQQAADALTAAAAGLRAHGG
jgi:cysteine desulfurase